MLITENAGPTHPQFVSLDEALESMQWMTHVLRNRLELGPEHFYARGATSLTALIKAHNQVDGFEKYPRIAEKQNDVLTKTLDIANDGADSRSERHRTYVEHALAVAKGKVGSDPCPTKLYAWRTAGSKSPGDNFVNFQLKGGQQFYTLADAFLTRLKPKTVGTR